MPAYDTLTEAITDLRRRDYSLYYNLVGALACCEQTQEFLRPEELLIKEMYRFEGESNPDDNMVLYALQSRKNTASKGLLVAAYGPYVETATADFIKQLDSQNAPR